MTEGRRYLGVPIRRPRVAFFEFSSCEGCQLQLLNNEETLLDFLGLVEVVNFREAMTERSDDYEIAFVEGSIATEHEEARLKEIRDRADLLVAFGSCACFGGVNAIRNRPPLPGTPRVANVEGQGALAPARAVGEIVRVDFCIFGCPVRKEEVEKIVTDLVIGKGAAPPAFPVCMECKARENICMYDLGEPCLGPVTRAGCDAWCPSNRCGCWGCRGPAEDPNVGELVRVMTNRGIAREKILERLECFGGFRSWAEEIRNMTGFTAESEAAP